MNITYNNLTNPSDTISFIGFPNIIKIEETNSGTKARLVIMIKNLNNVVLPEYTFTINGQIMTSTMDISAATGNKFYLTRENTEENRMTVAYKMMECLRNLPTLSINYDIYLEQNDSTEYSFDPSVVIEAKEIGTQFNFTDLGGTFWISGIATFGWVTPTSTSTLLKGKVNKIMLDVYKRNATEDKIGNEYYSKGQYVTTLAKEIFGDNVYFDMTPLLTSLAEYGTMSQINVYVSLVYDDKVLPLGTLKNIYFTTGYSVNQGLPFINKFNKLYLAQNVLRGTTKGTLNNTTLYVYEPHIDLSLFANTSISQTTIIINYINSARAVFASQSIPVYVNDSLNNLVLNLDSNNFNNAFFIDVVIEEVGTLRYNVIKPLKATDEIQRVYWTNSYGGTSFFDFTGSRSETRKTKVDYYQKNLFNFYDEDTVELNKVYNKTITITVSLTSHNIEKDGTWIFFDMQNSKNAWTYVNNKKYFITITDLKVTESSVNDIYTAQIEYEYSMADTF